MKWGRLSYVGLLMLLLVVLVVPASAGGGPYVLELAGGESSILDYGTNYMAVPGDWATEELRRTQGRELGLPDGGHGWLEPQLCANREQSAWHYGIKIHKVQGNLMIPQPGVLTGRGRVEFTLIGTNLNCDYFTSSCKPAFSFAGSGRLTVTDVNSGGTLCFQLNTGKVPIAVDVSRPIRVVFDGVFFQADYGPTSPAAGGRELRWPYVLPNGQRCS